MRTVLGQHIRVSKTKTLSISVFSLALMLLMAVHAGPTGACARNSVGCALSPHPTSQNWGGTWNSNYGEMRLVKAGNRVFGDYAERGTIEAVASQDGTALRGVFLYTDGRWGTIDWHLDGEVFSGSWRWSDQGMTEPEDSAWTATKTSDRTSTLKFASPNRSGWPGGVAPETDSELGQFIAGIQANPSRPAGPSGEITEDFGPWYGGYTLDQTGGFDLALDVDQIGDGRSGSATIDIALNAIRPACPQGMKPAFCQELIARGRSMFVATRTVGVLMDTTFPPALYVAFKLDGDRDPRLLRIGREATYLQATITHPERGVEFDGTASTGSHSCQQGGSGCANEIVNALRRNPDANIGVFADLNFLSRYGYKDNSRRTAKRDDPVPVLPPNDPLSPRVGDIPDDFSRFSSFASGIWSIDDIDGGSLGKVTISQTGPILQASGSIEAVSRRISPSTVRFGTALIFGNSLRFELTDPSPGSSNSPFGHLLVGFGNGAPRGTLVVGNKSFLIKLGALGGQRDIGQLLDIEPPHQNAVDQSEPLEGDLPAIGIWGFQYELHNVPAGRALSLRASPDRKAREVGRVTQLSPPFVINECQQLINSFDFEKADIERKVRLLSIGWCKIQLEDGTLGWIPGSYIFPLPRWG